MLNRQVSQQNWHELRAQAQHTTLFPELTNPRAVNDAKAHHKDGLDSAERHCREAAFKGKMMVYKRSMPLQAARTHGCKPPVSGHGVFRIHPLVYQAPPLVGLYQDIVVALQVLAAGFKATCSHFSTVASFHTCARSGTCSNWDAHDTNLRT